MRVLLDTHALLWWLFDNPRLSRAAREAIAPAESEVLVSSASAWEIATKYRLGKLPEVAKVANNLPQVLKEERMVALPISLEHALTAGGLEGPHRDPFDRMLIAQGMIEDIPIITRDPAFQNYVVKLLW